MEFKTFQEEHLNAVLELSDIAFGKNYLNSTALEKYINSNNTEGSIIFLNQKVVGFLFIDILTPSELQSSFLKEKDWIFELFKPSQEIALIKHIVISDTIRNKGLGTKLLNFSTFKLIAEIQVSTVWKKPEEPCMAKLLSKAGFSYSKTISNYWQEESLVKKYGCQICGEPPCVCDMEVYIKKKH